MWTKSYRYSVILNFILICALLYFVASPTSQKSTHYIVSQPQTHEAPTANNQQIHFSQYQFPFPMTDRHNFVHSSKNDVAKCYQKFCTTLEGEMADNDYTPPREGCSNPDRQDLILYTNIFKNPLKINGTFVEIGSMGGWHASNTLFFEKCLGWKGIMFELSKINYDRLVPHRPNVFTIHGTTCKSENGEVFVLKDTYECCSKVVEVVPEEHKDKYISVPCKPMTSWLNLHNFSKIDYFSLDVEGHELEVLQTIDWKQTSIRVLTVEMLPKGSPGQTETEFANQDKIRELLKNVGLTYIPYLSINGFYEGKFLTNHDEFWVNLSWVE